MESSEFGGYLPNAVPRAPIGGLGFGAKGFKRFRAKGLLPLLIVFGGRMFELEI